jgi:hypothetical protein
MKAIAINGGPRKTWNTKAFELGSRLARKCG